MKDEDSFIDSFNLTQDMMLEALSAQDLIDHLMIGFGEDEILEMIEKTKKKMKGGAE